MTDSAVERSEHNILNHAPRHLLLGFVGEQGGMLVGENFLHLSSQPLLFLCRQGSEKLSLEGESLSVLVVSQELVKLFLETGRALLEEWVDTFAEQGISSPFVACRDVVQSQLHKNLG